MIAVGLATGLTVRIGQELSTNVARAKRIAVWCMGFAIAVGALVSILVYWCKSPLVRLFTNDDEVLQVSARGNYLEMLTHVHNLHSL